jgi:hypothetical protein
MKALVGNVDFAQLFGGPASFLPTPHALLGQNLRAWSPKRESAARSAYT